MVEQVNGGIIFLPQQLRVEAGAYPIVVTVVMFFKQAKLAQYLLGDFF